MSLRTLSNWDAVSGMLLVELRADYWSVLRTATSPAIFFGQMAENHEFLLSL